MEGRQIPWGPQRLCCEPAERPVPVSNFTPSLGFPYCTGIPALCLPALQSVRFHGCSALSDLLFTCQTGKADRYRADRGGEGHLTVLTLNFSILAQCSGSPLQWGQRLLVSTQSLVSESTASVLETVPLAFGGLWAVNTPRKETGVEGSQRCKLRWERTTNYTSILF